MTGGHLRPLRLEDIDALYCLTLKNCDDLMPWLPWVHAGWTREESRRFIVWSREQLAAGGALQFGLWMGAELVGCVGLRDVERPARASIGYWLDSDHQRQGLMTRAVGRLIAHAFDELGFEHLEIHCGMDNQRSQAIPTRLGFERQGVVRDAERVQGRAVDHVVYGRSRAAWRATVPRQSHPEMSMLGDAPRSWNRPDHYLLALRDPWYKSLVRLQDAVSVSSVEFFRSRQLTTLHLPVTTNSASSPMGLGSDSRPVLVNLFGIDTFLADSMQFMLEYGARLTSGGCYYLMPSFRGEDADPRHLCQFYHSEAEIPGTLDEVIALVEAYLAHMSRHVLDNCAQYVERSAGSVRHIEDFLERAEPLPRLTFTEAARLLGDDPTLVQRHPAGCRSLTPAGERRLIEWAGGFVWVTHPDHLSVPFYQAFSGDQSVALAADLLFGIGEVVGAGQRHVHHHEVERALALHQVGADAYRWYIDMKRAHPMQTSGFGLGTERYMCWVLQHDDVRDCQLLPRFNGQVNVP